MLDCSKMTNEEMADILRSIRNEVLKRRKKATGLSKLELGGALEDLNSAIGLLGDEA